MGTVSKEKGLRFLCLDDGPIADTSQLHILKEIMGQIQHDRKLSEPALPHHYFDLIGGTGTGGLIALMLGRLGMSVDDALERFPKIFEFAPNTAGTIITARTNELEKRLVELFGDHPMMPSNSNCKTFVCALPVVNAGTKPRLYRSYNVRNFKTANCTIVEAARATLAKPGRYSSITIGGALDKEEVVGDNLGFSQPLDHLLAEAPNAFGKAVSFQDLQISCVVNVSHGHPGIVSMDSLQRELLAAAETGKAIERAAISLPNQLLFSLRVQQGLQHSLDVNAQSVVAHSQSYLREHSASATVERVVNLLQTRAIPFVISSPSLPANTFLAGRGAEVKELVNSILLRESTSAILLGSAGIGKTSIARTILHDSGIVERFGEYRYFMSCDAPNMDLDTFHERTAAAIGMSLQQAGSLEYHILNRMGGRHAILCIDNFETLWQSHEGVAEEALVKLSAIPKLTIIVTMRGAGAPARTKWDLRLKVTPLDYVASCEVYSTARIVGSEADHLDKHSVQLIKASDGMPLVLELLGRLAQHEGPASVLGRWKADKTLIELNLHNSIKLSLSNPAIKEEPFAIPTLQILSYLPDGMSRAAQDYLGVSLRRLSRSISILLKSALAHKENVMDDSPVRLLSPLREFVQSEFSGDLPPENYMVAQYYANLVRDKPHPGSQENIRAIRSELLNIRFMLMLALDLKYEDQLFVHAITDHAWWMAYTGLQNDELVVRTLEEFSGLSSNSRAACHQRRGHILTIRNRLHEGVSELRAALQLHIQCDNMKGQGWDLIHLGTALSWDHQAHEAEVELRKACNLLSNVDPHGQATALTRLGQELFNSGQYSEARLALKAANDIFKKIGDSLNAGDTYNILGELSMADAQYQDAVIYLLQALHLQKEAFSIRGEGISRRHLGDLSMRLNYIEDAEKFYQVAIERHQRCNDIYNEGLDRHFLGELYIKTRFYDDAEKELFKAIRLHQEARDAYTEGIDRMLLEALYKETGREPTEAFTVLPPPKTAAEQVESELAEIWKDAQVEL